MYRRLLKSNIKYNPTLVRNLIQSNRNNFGYIKDQTKVIIFFMMKKLIMKGIAKFSNINYMRGNEAPFQEEDIVNEIYITFDRCLEKYSLTQRKNFYLYFNKAISNRIRRIANYIWVYTPGAVTMSLEESVGNDFLVNSKVHFLVDKKCHVLQEEELWFWKDVRQKIINYQKNKPEAIEEEEFNSIITLQFKIVRSLYEKEKIRDFLKKEEIKKVEYMQNLEEIKIIFNRKI